MAALVTSASDFCSQMRWPVAEADDAMPSLFPEMSPEEEAVIAVLTARGEATLADLSSRIDLPVARLMSMLIDMEFRAPIISIPGGRYRLR